MNSVNVVGRLGADAEMRYTTSGKAVSSVNLALDIGWGDNKKTLWVKITLWAKQAESLTKYLTKGKQIAVSGELSPPESWISKQDGTAQARVVITARNIKLLGGGEQRAEETERPPDISDEDIPF